MKTMNRILASTFIISMIISVSTPVFAHSGHESARLPLVWIFNEKVNDKISRAVHQEGRMNLVGLSHMEQTALERYGIKIGQSFYTEAAEGQVLVERTNSGLKILEGMTMAGPEVRWQAPVLESFHVVPSSIRVDDHHGHHHKHLNMSWLFDRNVTGKIKRHLQSGDTPLTVGLSVTEQKMIDNYGIKSGHSFVTTVGGEDYLVKRVTTGLQVMKKIDATDPVAILPTGDPLNEVKG